MATFKIDGLIFALGVLFGIFLFGETVDSFAIWWNSSYMGRFTLPELFGVETGWVVLGVVLMALFMFWGGELLEKIFGGKDPKDAPKWRYYGAGVLVLMAVGLVIIGQPTIQDRWNHIADEMNSKLAAREVHIHPGEVAETIHDHALSIVLLDVRNEADYNLFHLADAQLVSLEELPKLSKEFQLAPANTVFIVMSNDEALATNAWKIMVSESVANVYILEGGINNWLSVFAQDDNRIQAFTDCGEEQLCYLFAAALGSAYPAADPEFHDYEHAMEFEKKIKLELKRAPSGGGCG